MKRARRMRCEGEDRNRTQPKTGTARQTATRVEAQILDALHQTLSEREIQLVLARGLQALGDAGQKRLFARLDPDTSAVLRAVLEPTSKDRDAREVKPGKDKLRQEWKARRSEWDECIAESGLEDGKYVCQDEHWEPPYLAMDSVTADLEQIARRMRPLLGRVWDEGLDPDFSFAGALEAAAEEAGVGLPDWMDAGEAPGFGREVTTCLLEWEWRAARRDGVSAFQFLDRVRRLERSLQKATLDEDAIAAFVAALGADEQREILRGFERYHETDQWVEVLGNARSGWFLAYQRLARKWDPKLFAKSCRDNIAQDFRLALPLVTERLRRKAYADALALIEEAVRAMLQLDVGQTWDPRNGLLIRHPALAYQCWDLERAHFRLLEAWRKAAAGLGEDEVACALDLQIVVGRKRDDWDAVLAAFRGASKPCEALFADWRTDAVERSVGVLGSRNTPPEPNWVHAVVDATRAGKADVFLDAARHWLRETERTPAALARHRSAFATLALDIDGAGHFEKRCPTLHRLLSRERSGAREADGVRRRWIAHLGGFDLFPDVVAFCKRNARTLVPDPSHAHASNYEDCAQWMAGILELDADAYRAILRGWFVDHRRRRNLWQALAGRRLPMPPA